MALSFYRTHSLAEFQAKVSRLNEKVKVIRDQMRRLERIEQRLKNASDGQLSLTDRGSRAESTSARRPGVVGYNVLAAVDACWHQPC